MQAPTKAKESQAFPALSLDGMFLLTPDQHRTVDGIWRDDFAEPADVSTASRPAVVAMAAVPVAAR